MKRLKNPMILFGKPVIKNTRMTVEHILRKPAGGTTIEEIIQDHPHLTGEDICSAQAFAADHLADEQIEGQRGNRDHTRPRNGWPRSPTSSTR